MPVVSYQWLPNVKSPADTHNLTVAFLGGADLLENKVIIDWIIDIWFLFS